MYILFESSKERYEEGIDTTVLSVSDSKELLARYLEKEILDKLSNLPQKFAKRVIEDFDKIKKGSPYIGIQIDDDGYIQLHFCIRQRQRRREKTVIFDLFGKMSKWILCMIS